MTNGPTPLVLLDFPCQIVLGIYAARWSTGPRATRPWMYAQLARLGMCAAAMVVVGSFPAQGVTAGYLAAVVLVTLLTSFASTTMFVSQGAFFARISDPSIGGTYLTLLNTFSNFGGTWPKLFVLQLVDYFTEAQCVVVDGSVHGECVTEHGKALCTELHGVCSTSSEGYYPVSTGCIVAGLVMYFVYIRPKSKALEKLPVKAWHVRTSLFK